MVDRERRFRAMDETVGTEEKRVVRTEDVEDVSEPEIEEMNGVQNSTLPTVPPADSLPEVAGSRSEGLACTCGEVVIPRGKTELGMVPTVFGEPGYVHRIPEEILGYTYPADHEGEQDLGVAITNGGGPCHELQ